MRIIQVKGCWAANIGNAFLDIGSRFQLETIFPTIEFCSVGGHNTWAFDYFSNQRFKSVNSSHKLRLETFITSDTKIVFFTGMVLTKGFVNRYKEFLSHLSDSGIFVLFNGAGLREYTIDEANFVTSSLKNIQNYHILTRDLMTYDLLKRSGLDNISDGIDAAWFISDAHKPSRFDILMNKTAINIDNKENRNLLRTLHTESGSAVHMHHSVFHSPSWQLKYPDTLISDQVEDYLSVYANVKSVITDRIHAAIASICYETEVALYTNSDRVEMFRRVGCEMSKKCLDFITINRKNLNQQKELQLQTLRGVLEDAIR